MIRKLSSSFLVLSLIFVVSSCKSAKKNDSTDVPGATTETTDMNSGDANTMGDSDGGKASGLQTIHFPYDSFAMDAEGKTTLKANAELLKGKPTLKVQIEGHCDQRGGIQYNIALGEKRANAVKSQLEKMGIGADRIATISYGKERLLDQGTSEEANAKNRRANFVITSK